MFDEFRQISMDKSEFISLSFPDGSFYKGSISALTSEGELIPVKSQEEFKQKQEEKTCQLLRHGEGTQVYFNSQDSSVHCRYLGEWSSGKIHGKGVMFFPDGSVFSGNFAAGKRTGFGKMEWKNGSKYCGMWAADQMHGNGIFIGKNTNFEGTFYKGNFVTPNGVHINPFAESPNLGENKIVEQGFKTRIRNLRKAATTLTQESDASEIVQLARESFVNNKVLIVSLNMDSSLNVDSLIRSIESVPDLKIKKINLVKFYFDCIGGKMNGQIFEEIKKDIDKVFEEKGILVVTLDELDERNYLDLEINWAAVPIPFRALQRYLDPLVIKSEKGTEEEDGDPRLLSDKKYEFGIVMLCNFRANKGDLTKMKSQIADRFLKIINLEASNFNFVN